MSIIVSLRRYSERGIFDDVFLLDLQELVVVLAFPCSFPTRLQSICPQLDFVGLVAFNVATITPNTIFLIPISGVSKVYSCFFL